MKLPKPNEGGDFTPTPAGQHMAVLTRLIDLGTQPGSQMYPAPKHKVLFGWEIPKHRIRYMKDDQEHEGPVIHFERMTFSMHENAVMRQRLESWRGKPFEEKDFGTFDMSKLLGVGALIQIAHEHKDGKVYANMQAIMLPPGGKETWPKPEGEFIHLSLDPDEFRQEVFDKLSDGLKQTIQRSPEYQRLVNGPEYLPQSENPGNGMIDDEIPF